MKAFAGLGDSDYTYKPLQSLNIVQSNYMLNTLVGKMLEEFVNPFGKELLNSKLYNLSSGIPVQDSVADRILKVFDDGKKCFELFVDERLLSNQKNLHATLPRLQVKLFMQGSRKVDIQANGKNKTFEAKRNIISTL